MEFYTEEISKDLAVELIGKTPDEEWSNWQLIINEYEVAVQGYNSDGKCQSYPVESTEMSKEDSDTDLLMKYVKAGGSVQEYKRYRLMGWLYTLPLFAVIAFFVWILLVHYGIL